MSKLIPVEIQNCNLKLMLSVNGDEVATDIKDQLQLIEEIKQNFDIEKLEKLALMISSRIESVEISGGSLAETPNYSSQPAFQQQAVAPQPMMGGSLVTQDIVQQTADPASYMLKYHPLRGKTCPEIDRGILEYYVASGVLGPEDRGVVERFLATPNSRLSATGVDIDEDDIPF